MREEEVDCDKKLGIQERLDGNFKKDTEGGKYHGSYQSFKGVAQGSSQPSKRGEHKTYGK